MRAVITSRVAVRTPTRDLRTVETIGPGRYYLSITPASPEACAYVLTQAWLLGTPVAWAYGASGSLEVAWVLGASGERALDILLAQKEVAADWSLIDLNALLARAIPVLFKPSSKYFRPQMRASEFVAMVRP